MSAKGQNAYPAPEFLQAIGGNISYTIMKRDGVKVRVRRYDGMAKGHAVQVGYRGEPKTPGLPYFPPPLQDVTHVVPLDFVIHGDAVDEKWRTLEIFYHVLIGDQLYESEHQAVAVGK